LIAHATSLFRDTASEPRFAIAFARDERVVKRALRAWIGSRSWLVDPALRRATVADLRGVYVPSYLYSAAARTSYSVRIGEHYTVEESYYESEPDGKRVEKTRSVTRTEYRPLAGHHLGYITDVLVSASRGVASSELARLGPWDFRQLRRFAPELISGWICETSAIAEPQCLATARARAHEDIGDRLRGFLPGNSHSDLRWRSDLEWESLDAMVVPVWVLAVRYRGDRQPLRVLINGQTGMVFGRAPWSRWRVALAIVALAAAAALAWWLMREVS
jgi:hypothetical protein